jgi:hypothetical protein
MWGCRGGVQESVLRVPRPPAGSGGGEPEPPRSRRPAPGAAAAHLIPPAEQAGQGEEGEAQAEEGEGGSIYRGAVCRWGALGAASVAPIDARPYGTSTPADQLIRGQTFACSKVDGGGIEYSRGIHYTLIIPRIQNAPSIYGRSTG